MSCGSFGVTQVLIGLHRLGLVGLSGALEDRGEGRPDELGPEDAHALARWIGAVEVPPDRRDDLARERATAVRDALVESHGVSPDRLRVGDPLTGPPAVVIQLAPVGR